MGVTSLDGVDNRQFLQGQLTCELDALTPSHSQLGAHCDAKGKMMAVLRLIDTDTQILAVQAAENTSAHLPQLAKYAVFSKVTITDDSAKFLCTGLSGQSSHEWLINEVGASLEAHNDAINTAYGAIVRIDINESTPRFLIVSNAQQHDELTQALKLTTHNTLSSELWFALDCHDGVAQIIPTTQAEFVPQVLNLQMVDAISFKKGCYIGQETVARMHFRGLNKRAMFVLQSSSHIACQVGDSVEKQLGDNWRNAGTIVSVQHIEDQTIACAILPTDFELEEKLRVKNGNEVHFSVSKPAYFVE